MTPRKTGEKSETPFLDLALKLKSNESFGRFPTPPSREALEWAVSYLESAPAPDCTAYAWAVADWLRSIAGGMEG